jgi:hypothetical protein
MINNHLNYTFLKFDLGHIWFLFRNSGLKCETFDVPSSKRGAFLVAA